MGKNHHYVPQFYLQNFSTTDKAIATYALKSEKLIKVTSIRKQCYRVNAYRRQEIEDQLCDIEGQHANIARYIIGSNERFVWPRGIRQGTREFVGLNHVRNVHKAEQLRKLMQMMIEGVNADGMGGAIYQNVKTEFESRDFVLQSLGFYRKLVATIQDLGVVIVGNETEKGFITSDNPVVVYNILFQDITGYSYRGSQSKGVIMYMPVSRRRSVLLFDKSVYRIKRLNDCFVRSITEDDVVQLNALTIVNAKDSIYFDESQAQTIEEDCKTLLDARNQKELVMARAVNEKDDRRELLHIHEAFPNLNVNLSFVAIPPKIVEKRMMLIRDRDVHKQPKNRHVKAVYRLLSETRQGA